MSNFKTGRDEKRLALRTRVIPLEANDRDDISNVRDVLQELGEYQGRPASHYELPVADAVELRGPQQELPGLSEKKSGQDGRGCRRRQIAWLHLHQRTRLQERRRLRELLRGFSSWSFLFDLICAGMLSSNIIGHPGNRASFSFSSRCAMHRFRMSDCAISRQKNLRRS